MTMGAGWYPDQVDATLERFWNGEAWTQQTRAVVREAFTEAAPNAISQSAGKRSRRFESPRRVFITLGVLVLLTVIAAVAIPNGNKRVPGASPAASATAVAGVMPHLIGMKRSKAEPLLQEIGISWDLVSVSGNSGEIIVKQTPASGEPVTPGVTGVTLQFMASSSGSSGGGASSNWPPAGYSKLSDSVAYKALDPSEMQCDYSGASCFQALFITKQSCSLYVEVNFLVDGVSVDRSNDLRTVSAGQPAILSFNSFTVANYSGDRNVRIVETNCY